MRGWTPRVWSVQPIHFLSGLAPGAERLDLVLQNDLADLSRLHRGVEAFAAAHHLPSPVVHAVDLSLTELVTNIISYAYEDSRRHEVLVHLELHGGEVRVRVEDDGRPFNPIQHPVPDMEAPLDERKVGGLGIHLVRKLMAGLHYQRADGRNIFVMKKRV